MQMVLFELAGRGLTAMDIAIILVIVVAAFVLGRLSKRSPADSSPNAIDDASPSKQAFMKGLSYMATDQTDQAIEEFSRAVSLHSEAAETYMILGNLFRQKGEIERAVRIRQSIIARPNLDPALRMQALFDLGLDYQKGGLFNRALETFQEILEIDSKYVEAVRQIVYLYEEMREWDKAFLARKRLDKLTGQSTLAVLAHYKTELGKELMQAGRLDQAEEAFEQAIGVYKGCLDAYLHLGDLHFKRGRNRKALSMWRKALKVSPELNYMAVNRVASHEEDLGEEAVETFFAEIDPHQAQVNTLLALAQAYHRRGQASKALDLLDIAVKKDPARLEAQRLRGLILLKQPEIGPALTAYAELLEQLPNDLTDYQCNSCGFISHFLFWKCPHCRQWDTMISDQNHA